MPAFQQQGDAFFAEVPVADICISYHSDGHGFVFSFITKVIRRNVLQKVRINSFGNKVVPESDNRYYSLLFL